MDRTAWIVVSLCLIAMGLWYVFVMPKMAPPPVTTAPVSPPVENVEAERVDGVPTVTDAAPGMEEIPEEISVLENELVRYEFTNHRGGLQTAQLLKHTEALAATEPIRINAHGRYPIGAVTLAGEVLEDLYYRKVEQTEQRIVYEATSVDGMLVRKEYELEDEEGEASGHLLDFRLTVTNPSDRGYPLTGQSFFAGAMAPLHPQEWLTHSGFFWNTGGKLHFKSVTKFRPTGFLGINFSSAKDVISQDLENMHWAGVANQFYTTIVRAPDTQNTEIVARDFPVVLAGAEEASVKKRLAGVELSIGIPDVRLEPGQSQSWDWEIYAGPKEYSRLAVLPDNQKAVMAYDQLPILGPIVKPVSQILIRILDFMHNLVGNWGVAIILMTIFIRIVIWPLHSKANKTMKRMSQLTPKMTEIREKYKEDPQKQQTEMMGLYRRYGVNPFGGCLPMLLQMPIFLGFYRMLMSATELRHESFFWIEDLSMPDTLFYIGSIPFNLLPILMAGTSFMQMAVTPKTGDKMQQRMFMFMPLMFLFICYNFASALALYWTVQNLVSTGQTWLFNKRQPPELQEIKGATSRKTWVQRLQEQAETARVAQEAAKSGKKPPAAPSTPALGGGKTYHERGSRSTKGKRRKK